MKRRSSKAPGFGNLDIEEYFCVDFFFPFLIEGGREGLTQRKGRVAYLVKKLI